MRTVAVFFVLLSVNIQLSQAHTRHVRGNVLEDVRELQYQNTSDVGHITRLPSNVRDTNVQRCATPAMTEEDRTERTKALALYKFKKGNRGDSYYNVNSPKVIPVCIHVVGRRISKRKLDKDFAALNKAYSTASCCDPSLAWCNGECNAVDTNIRFVMAKLRFKRIVGTTERPSSLFSCVQWKLLGFWIFERLTKRVLRRGDNSTLNIYYTSIPGDVLGYAEFPSILNTDPILDGVVIDRKVRVDGALKEHNEGDTLAHMVGHWLGVDHTFDSGCEPGDGVPDTAPENEPYFGCDPSSRRDTCPGDNELDPIHNFMDTSDDACLYKWTQGQINLMHATYEYFRSKNRPDISPVALTDGFLMEGLTVAEGDLRQFFIDVPESKTVACQIYADNGYVELFMNWDGFFSRNECMAISRSSEATCVLRPGTGRAYLWLYTYPGRTAVDMSIRCNLVGTATSGGAITANVPLAISNLDKSALVSYTLGISASGLSYANCTLTSSGDVYLFMGLQNSFDDADCKSQIPNTSSRTCIAGPMKAGTVYIWLFARSAAATSSITCNVEPFDATELTSGVESAQFNVLVNERVYFYLPAADLSRIACVTKTTSSTDGGDVDLFMNWNDPLNHECGSQKTASSVEVCELKPASGIAFAVVVGYAADTGVTITCTAEAVPVTQLTNAQASGPYDAREREYRYFSFPNVVNSYVSCSLTGPNGDMDLYMNWDGSQKQVCASKTYGSNEQCTIGPKSGTAYIIAYAFAASTGYTVTCTTSTTRPT